MFGAIENRISPFPFQFEEKRKEEPQTKTHNRKEKVAEVLYRKIYVKYRKK
jgi:hypothetical protein